MRCPFCKELNQDKVIDSRLSEAGEVIRRRRMCLACNKRFTTKERAEADIRLMVVKRDGRRDPFDRGKILRGLQMACHKRNVDADVLERITDEIERDVVNRFEREVASHQIGEMLMARLRQLDHVAYVRFASVYRQFRDVTQFRELAEVLDAESKEPPKKEQPRLPYG